MRPVLFRGYFGHGNWGDEILLRALIAGLTRSGISADKLHYWRGRNHAYQPAGINHAIPRGLHGMTAWAKAGAMIFSGGIFYDHLPIFGSRRLRSIHNIVWITRASGKKAILFGVSIGPLITAQGRRLTRKILKMVDGIWVRDRQSYQFCHQTGVPCRQIPDLSTVLASRIVANPSLTGQKELLFIPCQTGLTYRAQIRLLEILQPVAQSRDLTIRVVPLHAQADTDLARRLCKQQGVELAAETFADPLRLFDRIKTAQFVVSARLHGGWAAYLTGRPFLQINYHPKCRGFAETIHLPDECLINPNTEGAAVRTGIDIWFAAESGIRAKLMSVNELEKKTIEAFVDLARLVNPQTEGAPAA
jgi:polysaccharide pyruvyl transferase WcaK-like protein